MHADDISAEAAKLRGAGGPGVRVSIHLVRAGSSLGRGGLRSVDMFSRVGS